MRTFNLVLIAVLLFFGSSTPAGADHNQLDDVSRVYGFCKEPDVEKMKVAFRSPDPRAWAKLVLSKDNTCIDARVLRIPPLYPAWFVRDHSWECIKRTNVKFQVFRDSKYSEIVSWRTMGPCPAEQGA